MIGEPGPRQPFSPGDNDPVVAPQTRPTLLTSWRLWLGVLLSVLCLALAALNVDYQELWQTLRSASGWWAGLTAASVLVTGVAKAWRWQLLLAPSTPSPRLHLPRLSSIWLAGTGVNLALPVPRAGDLLRIYLTGEAGQVSKSLVLGTLAAEKLLDAVFLALCFLALLILMALPQEVAQQQVSTMGVATVMVAAAVLLLWQRARVVSWTGRIVRFLPFGSRVTDSLERGVEGLAALRQPNRLLGLVLVTAAIWFLSVLTNYWCFLALHMPASWVQSLFVFVVLQVGVALPSTPGKFGVFPLLCRWALGVFGVASAAGLAYGILLYGLAPVLLMICGALCLVIEGWRLGKLPTQVGAAAARGSDAGAL